LDGDEAAEIAIIANDEIKFRTYAIVNFALIKKDVGQLKKDFEDLRQTVHPAKRLTPTLSVAIISAVIAAIAVIAGRLIP
jgi:hypothetical protein